MNSKNGGCLGVFGFAGSLLMLLALVFLITSDPSSPTPTASEPTAKRPQPIATQPSPQSPSAVDVPVSNDISPFQQEPPINDSRSLLIQKYEKQFQEPIAGKTYRVEMNNGARIEGKLVDVGVDSITLQKGAANIGLFFSDMPPHSRNLFWKSEYVNYNTDMELAQEMQREVSIKHMKRMAEIKSLETERDDLRKKLNSRSRIAKLKVIQVIGSDALCSLDDTTILVRGLGSSVFDGDAWTGNIYFIGSASYTTVLGAPKKVREYSIYPSSDAAIIRQQIESTAKKISELKGESQ